MKNKTLLTILFTLGLAISSQLKAQVTVTYTYDNLHRLTKAVYSNGVGIQYTYDALGNRTQEAKTSNLAVEEMQNDNSVKVYPNPFADQLFISTKNQKIKQISIFDLAGKLVKRLEINNLSDYQLEAAKLVSGVYIVSVQTDKGTESFKVIKK